MQMVCCACLPVRYVSACGVCGNGDRVCVCVCVSDAGVCVGARTCS